MTAIDPLKPTCRECDGRMVTEEGGYFCTGCNRPFRDDGSPCSPHGADDESERDLRHAEGGS